MLTKLRTPQCNNAIRILCNHKNERAVVTDLNIDKKGSFKIWRFKDGYSVLKYNLATIAYYSPHTNEVESIKANNLYFKRALQKYTIVETRDN